MYIIELFSEKEDQVRLISFLLSALLAIAVLLINQYINTKRNKRDLLLTKIEELYKTSIAYTHTCTQILDDVQHQKVDYPTVNKEHQREIQNILRKMEMLCGLYFPDSGYDTNDYRLWNMQVLEYLEKGKHTEESELYCMWEDARQHIVNADAKLAVICSNLMKSHGYKA
ncbi:hypothetical protein TUM4261_32690 [Shewanella sp. c952]|uniref:hypothetical protein n=1 Tax=Shewanella sp. c952 TaxID=2815913 RepID=UPI001BBC2A21|nr:hypothetical protein [Shewanella sp. c952]GIU15562.1 hypothetical protein TUM4261_32690 [Shewanella sp. c952]